MSWFKPKRIFLDHAAGENNPSAIYKEGVEAKRRLEEARTVIARLLQIQARDVVFTSSGTESNNLALLGIFEAAKEKFPVPHFVTTDLEHPAILEVTKEIKRRGGEVTIVQTEDGVVKVEDLIKEIKPSTVLVSVMYVNNETGAIQPIKQITRNVAALRKQAGNVYPYIHTDASQAAPFLSLQFSTLGVDLLTLDGSKVNNMRGGGILALRPRVLIHPIMFGGGQERGLRPGTENVEIAQALATNLSKIYQTIESRTKHLQELKDLFIEEIKDISGLTINTPPNSIPNIISINLGDIIHEFLVIKLDQKGVCVSTGSSCKSQKNQNEKDAIRLSFGLETTPKDVQDAARILKMVVLN